MPIHPPTGDGYFIAGDPITGNRPAGAFPSLDFFNALLDLLDSNTILPPVTLAVETTLTAEHGLIFVDPPDGETVLYHLPVYAAVAVEKNYRLVNVGQGLARIDAIDGKTIDKQAYIDLAPGDKSGAIVKFNANWRTT